MSRFNSELYDKVFPRPVKTKAVESAVEDFKETETVVETEFETKEVETEVETKEVETEVEEKEEVE